MSKSFAQYDDVGNRLTRTVAGFGAPFTAPTNQTFNFDKGDRLDNDGDPSTASTWFDANGNTTNFAGTFQYDVENRLTNANNGAVLIVYNGDGQRVKKIAGGVTRLYLVDAHNPSGYAQILEELTVSGGSTNLSRAYTWGLSLISQRQPGVVTNFYGFDGHGSVRFLLSLAGGITDTYTYDAFGTLIGSTGTTSNNYRFGCEWLDSNLGLYDNKARWLNTDIGRFQTMDTYEGQHEDPLSLHKYLYAADNPVDNTDPSGEEYEAVGMLMVLDVSFVLASPKIAGEPLGRLVHGRPLTQGETNLSKTVFGSKINYTLPKVFNRPWIVQSCNQGVTPDGNIYVRGNGTHQGPGCGTYSADYSAETDITWKGFFLHEMTHVWQHQGGVWVTLRRGFWATYHYNYSKLGTKGVDEFKNYGIEQQAMIIEDYHYRRSGAPIYIEPEHTVVPNPPPLATYQKVLKQEFPGLQ